MNFLAIAVWVLIGTNTVTAAFLFLAVQANWRWSSYARQLEDHR